MAFPWGIPLPFLIGLAYGLWPPRRMSTMQVWRTGVPLAFGTSIILNIAGIFLQQNPFGLIDGHPALAVSFFAMPSLFLLGIWMGGLLRDREGEPS